MSFNQPPSPTIWLPREWSFSCNGCEQNSKLQFPCFARRSVKIFDTNYNNHDSPCTIRSLRTSCRLCRTGSDTWYQTGSWRGAWHCPNKPSGGEHVRSHEMKTSTGIVFHFSLTLWDRAVFFLHFFYTFTDFPGNHLWILMNKKSEIFRGLISMSVQCGAAGFINS